MAITSAAGHGVGRDLEAAVDLLARETDGNPFLLVELWLHLIDTGRLARRNDRWTVVRPLTDAVDRIASRRPPELRELFLTKGRVAVALDRRAYRDQTRRPRPSTSRARHRSSAGDRVPMAAATSRRTWGWSSSLTSPAAVGMPRR